MTYVRRATIPRDDFETIGGRNVFHDVPKSGQALYSRRYPKNIVTNKNELLKGNYSYWNVLERSNWPLYLADNNDLFCELEGLDIERTDLDSAVYEIARIHLDERWLASVADRWSERDELPDGKRAVLKRAIDFHIGRQYDACVSILMCMVEGIIVEYFGPSFDYSSEEEAALFDDFAVEHNLNPLGERKSTKLKAPKDIVLAMSLQTDKG